MLLLRVAWLLGQLSVCAETISTLVYQRIELPRAQCCHRWRDSSWRTTASRRTSCRLLAPSWYAISERACTVLDDSLPSVPRAQLTLSPSLLCFTCVQHHLTFPVWLMCLSVLRYSWCCSSCSPSEQRRWASTSAPLYLRSNWITSSRSLSVCLQMLLFLITIGIIGAYNITYVCPLPSSWSCYCAV